MQIDIIQIEPPKHIEQQVQFLNTDALIIANTFETPNEIKALKHEIKNKNPNLNFKICHILQTPDSKELRRYEQRADFIAVQGANPTLNKFAASTKRVDFLLQPFIEGKPVFDTAIARLCAQSKTTVLFPLAPILNAKPLWRSVLIKNAKFCAKLCNKFMVECMFVSGAKEPSELRAAQDLAALATLVGFSPLQAKRFTERYPETLWT